MNSVHAELVAAGWKSTVVNQQPAAIGFSPTSVSNLRHHGLWLTWVESVRSPQTHWRADADHWLPAVAYTCGPLSSEVV